jgi:hypothetical protein
MLPRRLVLLSTIALAATAGGAATKGATALPALNGAHFFAVGGVGITDTTTEGETAFRELREAGAADAQFKTAVESSTPAGKCYALIGLRLKKSPALAQSAKALAISPIEVETAAGCMISKVPIGVVVTATQAGTYYRQTQRKITSHP